MLKAMPLESTVPVGRLVLTGMKSLRPGEQLYKRARGLGTVPAVFGVLAGLGDEPFLIIFPSPFEVRTWKILRENARNKMKQIRFLM